MGRKSKRENAITGVVEIPLALVQVASKLERAQAELRMRGGESSGEVLADEFLAEARDVLDSVLIFIAGDADLGKLEKLGTLPDIEEVSALVHQAWIDSKLAQGVKSRKAEDGEELMVWYGFLSEKAKELDRATVRAVYQAIEASKGGTI